MNFALEIDMIVAGELSSDSMAALEAFARLRRQALGKQAFLPAWRALKFMEIAARYAAPSRRLGLLRRLVAEMPLAGFFLELAEAEKRHGNQRRARNALRSALFRARTSGDLRSEERALLELRAPPSAEPWPEPLRALARTRRQQIRERDFQGASATLFQMIDAAMDAGDPSAARRAARLAARGSQDGQSWLRAAELDITLGFASHARSAASLACIRARRDGDPDTENSARVLLKSIGLTRPALIRTTARSASPFKGPDK
jgi:hypothetical protein